MDDVEVGRQARIRCAIIDKGVRVPEGYRIGFHPEEDAKKFTLSPSGVVVIPRGTILT
jgi:glucose-1-phosphate adenylyltransferase